MTPGPTDELWLHEMQVDELEGSATLYAALLGALLGDVLAVAGAIDVEADGVHGGAVEDGDGERRVAEVASPGGEPLE